MDPYLILPTEAFCIANMHLGWGERRIEPNGSLWFIGLEETSGWKDQHLDEFKRSPCEILPFGEGPPNFKELNKGGGIHVRAYSCKLAQPLSSEYATSDWRTYRNERFWRKNCGLLQLNFYPLGKPKWNTFPEEEWCRRFDLRDWNDYEAKITPRLSRIGQLKNECGPQAVVCFGYGGWSCAKKAFSLNGKPDLLDGGAIEVFDSERIVLTPFFGGPRGMTDKRATVIADRLKSWGVSLP